MQGIVEGNEQEFRDFYEKTHRKVYAFALKHAGDEERAEDIVQLAYVKLWEKRAGIKPEYLSFKSYLFTTVRNQVIKEYQRMLKEQQAGQAFYELYDEQEKANAEKLVEKVQEAVQTLPSRQQEVFQLVKFEGLTYREAAEELGLSESTLEKHMIQALKTLRKKLSQFAYTMLL